MESFVVECAIYKSSKKPDTYLFVETQGEFDRVPKTLLDMLGQLEFVMTLDLDRRQKLAQADPRDVKKWILEQGYFLQLPPKAYVNGSA